MGVLHIVWVVFKRVFQGVFIPLSIPLIKSEMQSLQRDIWRIDQKINRHLRSDPAAPDSNGKSNPSLIEAYPFLATFPNPWVKTEVPSDGVPGRGAERTERSAGDLEMVSEERQ